MGPLPGRGTAAVPATVPVSLTVMANRGLSVRPRRGIRRDVTSSREGHDVNPLVMPHRRTHVAPLARNLPWPWMDDVFGTTRLTHLNWVNRHRRGKRVNPVNPGGRCNRRRVGGGRSRSLPGRRCFGESGLTPPFPEVAGASHPPALPPGYGPCPGSVPAVATGYSLFPSHGWFRSCAE